LVGRKKEEAAYAIMPIFNTVHLEEKKGGEEKRRKHRTITIFSARRGKKKGNGP